MLVSTNNPTLNELQQDNLLLNLDCFIDSNFDYINFDETKPHYFIDWQSYFFTQLILKAQPDYLTDENSEEYQPMFVTWESLCDDFRDYVRYKIDHSLIKDWLIVKELLDINLVMRGYSMV
jgi:hypothetical protein